MPVHDWTRVTAGIFHHFHQRWIAAIADCLNAGRLPPGYYALAEQVAGDMGPDVAIAEPKVRFTAQTEMDQYALKQNTLVVHHSGGDQVVALIEIVSPGNKASRRDDLWNVLFTLTTRKAVALLRHETRQKRGGGGPDGSVEAVGRPPTRGDADQVTPGEFTRGMAASDQP